MAWSNFSGSEFVEGQTSLGSTDAVATAAAARKRSHFLGEGNFQWATNGEGWMDFIGIHGNIVVNNPLITYILIYSSWYMLVLLYNPLIVGYRGPYWLIPTLSRTLQIFTWLGLIKQYTPTGHQGGQLEPNLWACRLNHTQPMSKSAPILSDYRVVETIPNWGVVFFSWPDDSWLFQ